MDKTRADKVKGKVYVQNTPMPSHEQQVLVDNLQNAYAALEHNPYLAAAILEHLIVTETEKMQVMLESETLMRRIGL